MAQIMKLTPMIYTRDMETTVNFYVKRLGFDCTAFQPDWGWASVVSGNAELMISLPNEHLPFEQPTFTGTFYLFIDDVDGLWEKVKELVSVAYPIESFDYGMREFGIYDNNGYMLQFGQEISE